NGEVNTADILIASTQVSPAGSNVATASISLDTACAYIASQSNGSQIKYEDINQIHEDDIEDMDINQWWNALTATRWATLLGSAGLPEAKTGEGETTTDKGLRICPDVKTSAESEDMSWTRLPEFADDTITDYSRPSPAIESTSDNLQNKNPSVTKTEASDSTILSKPAIKFVKAVDRPTENKTDKVETVKKPVVQYDELYRKTSNKSNVRGNQRNWNNAKSQQLGENFVIKNKACFNCGHFDHLSYDCGLWVKKGRTCPKNNYTHKSMPPKTAIHKPNRSPMRPTRPNMNDAQAKWTSFYKPTHSYVKRPFQRRSAFGIKFQALRVPTVNRKFPTVNRKFPTVNRKFPTGNTKFSTADLGNQGKAVKASACWIWKPTQNLSNKDECMLWHRRLGHLNIKTMNRLVRHNLVRGLPSKCFDNNHTCIACLKGKQHKASCKTKLVNSLTKPLHTLHMDLFGPTSDETSGILRNFITEIETLKDLKVKIIRCDNRGEFRNKEMNDFCSRKGIKREFRNPRTPQQNRVAERRNKTLIEAARTMLVDAKLPVTFWAETVNTACYVQNRVLVNKS
nr:hypothetical protein [Tanacetum cinerariifolium]